jgi:ElaB/YqjD/DUF883 family membrane-anchored ribosome-binding protein
MSNAEQLERETERTRTQLADTLDELRACMTPGHLVDQIADRFSDGAAAAFTRNLKDQAVNNPLPVAIMGASLAWMMLAPRSGPGTGFLSRAVDRIRTTSDEAIERVGAATNRASESARGKTAEWGDGIARTKQDAAERAGSAAERAMDAADRTGQNVRETANSMLESTRDAAGQTADSIREKAGSMTDSVQRTVSEGYQAAADTALRSASSLSGSAKAAGQRTLQKGSSLIDFCREQPLLLTSLGLAVGTLMGALLPATETEGRLMGEASDQLREQARDLASEKYQDVKQVGERALDAAQSEAGNPPRKDEGTSDEAAQSAHGEEPAPPLVHDEPQGSDGEWRDQPWKSGNAPG